MANFIELDQSKFPNTKGMNQNGFRFYQIDGKNYPSITSILSIQKKEGLEILELAQPSVERLGTLSAAKRSCQLCIFQVVQVLSNNVN